MDGGLGVWGGVGLAGPRQQSIVKEINERGSRVCVRSFWKGESRKQGGVGGGQLAISLRVISSSPPSSSSVMP